MNCPGIDAGKYYCTIGSETDSYTFYGVLETFYEECSKYWKSPKTRRQYGNYYNNLILPNLPEHNTKLIGNYTKQDYDAVIDSIRERGQGKAGSPFSPYADSTLQTFRRLIAVVVKVGVKHKLCDDVLWGSCYNAISEDDAERARKERLLLKKSLTVSQERAVFNALLSDYTQRGQEMGLALMYSLGLRNNEACAASFGDIQPMDSHPKSKVLIICKSTVRGSNIMKASGKTRNADRILPLPDRLANFLEHRRQYVQDSLNSQPGKPSCDIDMMPIACVGTNYTQRCAAHQLTAAGRELFRTVGMDEREIAYIDFDLSQEVPPDEDQEASVFQEKDPTAYLLRRHLGTTLHILGLTEPEIEYFIGHDIQDMYETRNEYINSEKLWAIKEKFDQHAMLGTHSSPVKTICQTPNISCNLTSSMVENNIRIPLKPGRVKIHISTNEPKDRIRVTHSILPSDSHVLYSFSSSSSPKEFGRTINILKEYHTAYKKKKS